MRGRAGARRRPCAARSTPRRPRPARGRPRARPRGTPAPRRRLVESAKMTMSRVAEGVLAGAARGPKPARAALRDTQGRAMPPSRQWWVMGRCPHRGWAPFSTSCTRVSILVVWRQFKPAAPAPTATRRRRSPSALRRPRPRLLSTIEQDRFGWGWIGLDLFGSVWIGQDRSGSVRIGRDRSGSVRIGQRAAWSLGLLTLIWEF